MNYFEQNFIVELSDITPNFGLKSTSILKYYQETFARYCAQHNVAGYNLYKMGLKWVFGQSFVEFLDVIPIWNEQVSAKVYISSVKKLRIYIDFEIKTNRGFVAKGQSIAYILDLETSRPKPVEMIIDRFKIDEDNLNGNPIKIDFTNDGTLISDKEHTITFSDVDYNNHTNNISYISLAFEGMPAQYVKEKYPKTMEIKYLQETFIKDTLRCKIYKNDDSFIYNIINSKDNSDVCIITTFWGNKNLNQDGFYDILEKMLPSCV